MDLKEIGCEDVDCIHMTQKRIQWRALVNSVNRPSDSVRGQVYLDYLSDYQILKKDPVLWS
jgi:hypothetical protein